MSEALTTDPMEFWRADVARRAEDWLKLYPNAKRKVEVREPEKAAMALYLLAETDTKHYLIAEKVGLTERELGQLTYHRPELWEKRRPELAQKMAATAEQLLDVMGEKLQRLQSDPDKIDEEGLKDIALALGIVTDKAANLNGMATMKVEHVINNRVEEFEAMRAEAQRRLEEKKNGAIEAEIVG